MSDSAPPAVDILVIDDDAELCELLVDYLGAEGYRVEAVHDGLSGMARALEGRHQLVVLDVMLPGASGFEVLRRLRSESDVPVLMLTARGEDVDRIVGLEMGADDYLAKPFNPRELVARIRAVQRRAHSRQEAQAPPTIVIGDVQIDLVAKTAQRGGEALALTSAEYELLAALLRTAGSVVSRETLTGAVLGRAFLAADRAIDVHVSNLRRKLGPNASGRARIRSVRGVGYVYGSEP